ncbi:hypothetical protein HGQ82_08765 [Clostridioides difficile]|uniref:hypothetical protein n=1 Tax=Clostridioides difficile TaxID=1496 RepID=UPI00146D468E|nr:hypothetical protein [Clostridioides difficile]NMU16448.1 hypothetical protein [Clostridioides difficile]
MGDKMLNINNIEVKNIFLGDKELNKIYLGNYLIYSKNQTTSLIKIELNGKFKSTNGIGNNVKTMNDKLITDIDNKNIVEFLEGMNKVLISRMDVKNLDDEYISDELNSKNTGFAGIYAKSTTLGIKVK